MGAGELHDVPFGNVFVNTQYFNVVLSVEGLVFYQRHVGHGNKGRRGVADGQFGGSASRLFLVEKTVRRNFRHKVPK